MDESSSQTGQSVNPYLAQRLQSWIKLSPFGISRLVSGNIRRIGFDALRYLDRVAIDPCLDSPPQRAARSAAAKSYSAHWNSQLGEQRERVFKRIRHSFKHSAHEVRRRVSRADARKRRAHFRVERRRSLTEQVRRPFEALAPCGDFRCCLVQRVVTLAAEEGLLEPT